MSPTSIATQVTTAGAEVIAVGTAAVEASMVVVVVMVVVEVMEVCVASQLTIFASRLSEILIAVVALVIVFFHVSLHDPMWAISGGGGGFGGFGEFLISVFVCLSC